MSLLSPHRAPSITHYPSTSIQDDLDIDTAALIAQLALDDLEEVFQGRKGKGRADSPLSDEEYAYQVQSEHYQHWLAIDAIATDDAYLEASIVVEAAAEADRRAAEMLSRGENLPVPIAAQVRLEDPTFVMHPDPQNTDLSHADHESDAESSDGDTVICDFGRPSQTSFDAGTVRKVNIARSFDRLNIIAGPSVNQNKIVNCTICNDQIRYIHSLHTPCSHHYCKGCVASLVEAFTRDESLFPLRCCQEPIPINNVIPFISLNLRRLFEEKHNEFSVLSKDRVYCVTPTCSEYLGSSVGITGWGVVCPKCSTSTCPSCKQASHEGEDCAVNAAMIELRALARREGWQTCPGCHTLVELNLRCYHMTCRCRTQFCYLCAVPWRNCQCPQWEEARLIETAQQRVENELGARAVRNTAPEVLQEQVRQHAENLRLNHHCETHNWIYRHGGGRCEECQFTLPQFLLICTGCSAVACVRCSRNRL